MKKIKRITAFVGACLLIIMYILTLVFALLDIPNWEQLFMAAIFCTVAIPVMIYAMQLVYRVLKQDKDDEK